MSEPTPGPWVFHPEDGRAPDGYLPIFGPVKGKDGFTFYPRIASVGALGGLPADNDPDGDYRARDEANARLIAAAPDLLAALKVCYEFTPFHTADCDGVTEYEEGSIFDNTKGCTCYLSKAAAAIAKALGQPQ